MTARHKCVRERRRGVLWLALVIVVCFSGCEDEESKRHLNFLNQLAAETRYPDFKQSAVSDNNKRGIARLFVYYKSSAQIADVNAFYSKTLTAKGWTSSPREGRNGILATWSGLVFQQGNYKIAISNETHNADYVIAYVWERP